MNRGARERERIEQERLWLRFSRQVALHVENAIKEAGQALAERYAEGGKIDTAEIALVFIPTIAKSLRRAYSRIIPAFASRMLARFRKTQPEVLETKNTEGAIGQLIRSRLRYRADEQAQKIGKTLSRKIFKAVQAGVDAGESYEKTASRILDVTSGSVARSKARTIARTEMHNASQAAQFEVVESLQLSVSKIWLAGEDDRTRHTHAEVDGQKRPHNEPFNVNGWPMQFPGDDSYGAPAGEIINCRCSLAYE